MKTFRLIGMALIAVIMSANFASCSDDEEIKWEIYSNYDVIINDMAFAITNEGATLISTNPNLAGGIEIPKEVYYEGTKTSYPVIAIHYGMQDCNKITSITIPNTVKEIGNGAFFRCTSLNNVVIPNGVISIGGSAFYNCTSLTTRPFHLSYK